MRTIEIEVNDSIYNKLIDILNKFKSEDLKILNNSFENDKKYLEEQLNELSKGNVEYITIDDLDNILEETLEKYGC